jgi:hypothetical protein
LGINALFPTERIDGVIKLACHRKYSVLTLGL